jgi:glycosyltransferase involved in cell wall biosynthesis
MNRPQISIIIPVYNTEKFVQKCIESIVKQTFPDFEAIFINDKSPDNAIKIVENYAKQDNRIKIVSNLCNEGLAVSRENGYKRAIGDYLVFVDSDDYLPENALEKLYNAIITQNADIIAGTAKYVSLNGKVLRIRNEQLPFGNDRCGVYKALLNRKYSKSVCFRIFRRKLFDVSYDIIVAQGGEEGVLICQMINKIKKVGVIDDVVYYYLQRPGSITTSKVSEKAINDLLSANSYIYNYIRNIYTTDKSIEYFIQKAEIRDLVATFLMIRNMKIIYKYAKFSDIDQLSKWKTLSAHYSGITLLGVYMIFHYPKILKFVVHYRTIIAIRMKYIRIMHRLKNKS